MNRGNIDNKTKHLSLKILTRLGTSSEANQKEEREDSQRILKDALVDTEETKRIMTYFLKKSLFNQTGKSKIDG